MIVGISGHFGSGKDVAAQYLVRTRNFRRIAFADALKHEVARVLARTLAAYAEEHYSSGLIDRLGHEALVHRLLWEERSPVTRALLQEWGTELRRSEDENYWVRQWARAAQAAGFHSIVTPDCRFRGEVRAIRDLRGRLVKVIRPGHTGNDHQSEHDLDGWRDWDAVLVNDGSIVDLEGKVEAWLQSEGL